MIGAGYGFGGTTEVTGVVGTTGTGTGFGNCCTVGVTTGIGFRMTGLGCTEVMTAGKGVVVGVGDGVGVGVGVGTVFVTTIGATTDGDF